MKRLLYALLLLPLFAWGGLLTTSVRGSATSGGGGGDPGAPDVWDDSWDFEVNRTDSLSTVVSTFQGQGYQSVENIHNGTADTLGGWVYTVTEIPDYAGTFPENAGRVLCVETRPDLQGDLWQADPSLVFFNNQTPGNLPADVWLQWWQFNHQDSTFDVRDKTFYISNGSENPETNYPSNNFPWLMLQGSGGFNYNPAPNDTDNFLALQAQRSEVPYDPGNDAVGNQKMFQNLSEAVITLHAWFQIKVHIDTSGAQGSAEMWIRERGESFTKVMEWLPGVTTHDPGVGGSQTFQWPTNEDDRSGAKAMIWPSTTNGQGRVALRCFGRLAIATAENLLPTGD